jgi:IMP dehydrogenase
MIEEGLSYDDVLLKPVKTSIKSRLDTDLSVTLSPSIELKCPIMSASMDTVTGEKMAQTLGLLGAMGIIHRFQTVEERFDQANNCRMKNLPVGVAIGLKDTIAECQTLGSVSDILSLDIAHAHSDEVLEFLKKLSDSISTNTLLMVGNIATFGAARDLIDAGADILKVGIGGGAVCTTRIITGFGVPNVTAIQHVSAAVSQHAYGKLISVVADGGIKNSGDIAKAIAAGADCVMLGSLLAGTDETPGLIIKNQRGDSFKKFRGMASSGARVGYTGIKPGTVAEGVTAMIPCKGPVSMIINELNGGLRSALTYGNARNLKEFHAHTEFVKVSGASINTSRPHVLGQAGAIGKEGE